MVADLVLLFDVNPDQEAARHALDAHGRALHLAEGHPCLPPAEEALSHDARLDQVPQLLLEDLHLGVELSVRGFGYESHPSGRRVGVEG